MRRRRLAVVTAWYPPSVGGIERYTLNLCRTLPTLGWDITILTCCLDGSPAREDQGAVRVIREPMLLLGVGRFPVPRVWQSEVRSLHVELTRWRPDVFLLQSHLFLSSSIGAALARRSGTPSVLIEHGSGYVTVGRPLVDLGLRLYEHLQVRYLRSRANRVYGVSGAAARWWETLGGRADGVVPNGVDALGAPPRDPSIRSTFGVPASARLAVFAGRLIREKGARELVTAFRQLAAVHPDAHLVIAGEGPALGDVRAAAMAHPRIHLLGALAHADVLRLFGAADIVANPSRYPEGLPTALLEAGAMRAAVLATPMGGTRELIRDEVDGLIVSTDQEMVVGLDRLLGDPATCERFANSLHQRVRQEFDWTVIAALLSDRLEQLIPEAERP